MIESRRILLAGILALIAIGGCADTEPAADEEATEAGPIQTGEEGAALSPESPYAGMPDVESQALTVADLDAYERGLQAEMEAVQQAIEQKNQATTSEDSLNAIFAATDMQTVEAGASAAGMSVDRYRQVSNEIGRVLAALGSTDLMGQSMDTTQIPPEERAGIREQLQQLESNRAEVLASLEPAVVEALQERAPRLDSLRLTLAGTRMQAAQ